MERPSARHLSWRTQACNPHGAIRAARQNALHCPTRACGAQHGPMQRSQQHMAKIAKATVFRNATQHCMRDAGALVSAMPLAHRHSRVSAPFFCGNGIGRLSNACPKVCSIPCPWCPHTSLTTMAMARRQTVCVGAAACGRAADPPIHVNRPRNLNARSPPHLRRRLPRLSDPSMGRRGRQPSLDDDICIAPNWIMVESGAQSPQDPQCGAPFCRARTVTRRSKPE